MSSFFRLGVLHLSCTFHIPLFCVLSKLLNRCLFLMNSFVTVSKRFTRIELQHCYAHIVQKLWNLPQLGRSQCQATEASPSKYSGSLDSLDLLTYWAKLTQVSQNEFFFFFFFNYHCTTGVIWILPQWYIII